ncbi:MAG: SIS domain-containing protein [Bacteroidota bacterium]
MTKENLNFAPVMRQIITDSISASIGVKEQILSSEVLLSAIEAAAAAFITTFRSGGKVLFCGNGGSAADAQHLAAELSGRFYLNRPPLFAEALHVNSSYLTAVGNDYGFDVVYARMIEAAGRPGDVLVAISTSGNSPNILQAIAQARKSGMTVIGMTGEKGGEMRNVCDILLNVPSSDTPRIQESHILVGHVVCQITEAVLFGGD